MEKGFELKVLDHGYVRYVDSMGQDSDVIEAARMSTGKGFEDWKKDFHLLDFLYRHKHTSPFEMCEFVIEVQCPVVVVWEWVRHRTQSYNIFSGRYAVMPDLHYLPAPERVQKQSKMNKQGSAEVMPLEEALQFIARLETGQREIYQDYEQAIETGVANELARLNTPMTRYTKMRVKANVLNWLRFFNLRLRDNAQYEIRVFAQAVADIFKQLWPKTWELFEEYDLYGASMSRTELNVLKILVNTIQENTGDLKFLNDVCAKAGLKGRRLSEFLEKVA